jgi:YD repeat-containing protein
MKETSMTKSAVLVLVGTVLLAASLSGQGRGQDQAPYPRLPAPPVKSPPDTTAPDIPGVVVGGTKVHLIRDLFHSTEGPIAMPDGSLLFTEQDAGDGQLVKIDNDGNVSTFVTNTNRTIGLAYDTKGRLIGVQSNIPRIAVLFPTRMTLVEEIDGLPNRRSKRCRRGYQGWNVFHRHAQQQVQADATVSDETVDRLHPTRRQGGEGERGSRASQRHFAES